MRAAAVNGVFRENADVEMKAECAAFGRFLL